MADGEDPEYPIVHSEESADMKKVVVKLEIPGLAVEKKLFSRVAKPKPGEAKVDVILNPMSLEMTANITKKGKTTRYAYKVNKLPGEIDKVNSKVEYKKDLVILTLEKTDDSSWAVLLSKNGLEQAPSAPSAPSE